MDFKTRYQYNPKTDLLGKGGFAIVYKAHDALLNRTVALKFFTVNNDKHTLIQEISRAISLEHPNLCRYYDASQQEITNFHGETEKMEIGVMEYLDGGDLKSYLQNHPAYLNELLTGVLRGLAFLHKRGIIHRDLKPQNILIKNTEDGPVAKITDFGISKEVGGSHTSSSQLMGTIEYMAPEQFSPAKYGIGGKISTNLDLWSFGLMVYELVSGETMFGSRGGQSSAEQVMSNILNDDLIDDKIKRLPEPYQTVVRKCLVKDAKQRAQSADELAALLQGDSNYIAPQQYETMVLPKQNNNVDTKILTVDHVINTAVPSPQPITRKLLIKNILASLLVLVFVYMQLTGSYHAGNFETLAGDFIFDSIFVSLFYWQLFLRGKIVWVISSIFFSILTVLSLVDLGKTLLAKSIVSSILDYFIPLLVLGYTVALLLVNPFKNNFPNKRPGFLRNGVIIYLAGLLVLGALDYFINQAGQENAKQIMATYTRTDTAQAKPKPGSPYNFYDNFSDASKWAVRSDTNLVQQLSNGMLVQKSLGNNGSVVPVVFGLDPNKKFKCSLTVKWISGLKNDGFGIVYCRDISNSGLYSEYTFTILEKGLYQIGHDTQDKGDALIDWTPSKYIHKGSELNILVVENDGNEINFYINGHKVNSTATRANFGGGFGMVIGGKQTVAFDDFRISAFIK